MGPIKIEISSIGGEPIVVEGKDRFIFRFGMGVGKLDFTCFMTIDQLGDIVKEYAEKNKNQEWRELVESKKKDLNLYFKFLRKTI